jgi:hypothetical protein
MQICCGDRPNVIIFLLKKQWGLLDLPSSKSEKTAY